MLAKTFAGILLGLPLTLALISVIIWIWPVSSEAVTLPVMMAFFPLWVGIMGATYMFRSGPHAWAWLAVANLSAFAALWVAKHTLPGL
ncbi:MAG: hypothetical protein AAGC76_07600 [Luteibacter sp.]|jgi:hypothetical protein|uniref:hypothetical protein n=1 Tax=Luteibacter sp. TaxID=1886636 RepID=UPI002808512C|nr:hypothetical protein [Luteibacter sp.]MDQ7995704.1 hypothetical protein [Luteibacter sp.]MDQ8047792.1 hypothetical protein [Luteibacter sp.]